MIELDYCWQAPVESLTFNPGNRSRSLTTHLSHQFRHHARPEPDLRQKFKVREVSGQFRHHRPRGVVGWPRRCCGPGCWGRSLGAST